MTEPVLKIQNLNVSYGAVKVLWDISLHANLGEKIAIIGANGAGKTTLLRSITGLIAPTNGTISINGKDIKGEPAYKIATYGIAMVPEGRKIFASLTVEENLKIAHRKTVEGKNIWDLKEVYHLFPVLKENRDRLGTNMSGGQQQMLAIGRALMANPSILIFDELSLGLAPVAIKTIYDKLEEIQTRDTTIILIEQNVQQSVKFADRVYCMLKGKINLKGRADELDFEKIRKAYFGE